MTRWRGAVVTCATLAVTILLVLSLPARAPAQPGAGTPAPTPAPTLARNVLHSSEGFDLEIPSGWLGKVDDRQTNRSVMRRLLAGNHGLEAPELVPSAWPSVPTDRVIVELVEYFGPPGVLQKTSTESAFPLDWQKAQDLRSDGAFAVRSLTFRHLGRALGFIAHIGPDAPAADVVRIPALVASLRPEPIPSSGIYRGWRVIGPVDSFALGSVTHFDAIAPNRYGFFLARGKETIFAHLDQAFVFNGGFMDCPVQYDPSTKTFVCGRSGDRWSRVGKLLTAQTPAGSDPFGLAYHEVLIKEGFLLVGGGMSGGRIIEDEAFEFGDRVNLPSRSPFTRPEIIARLESIAAVAPIQRTAAKLVPSDALGSALFPGLTLPPGRVWVVAFSGVVHSPQGDPSASMGNWVVFVADPTGGGVITAMCCDGADWPAAFDALTDLGS
jgi:hypothetical protein